MEASSEIFWGLKCEKGRYQKFKNAEEECINHYRTGARADIWGENIPAKLIVRTFSSQLQPITADQCEFWEAVFANSGLWLIRFFWIEFFILLSGRKKANYGIKSDSFFHASLRTCTPCSFKLTVSPKIVFISPIEIPDHFPFHICIYVFWCCVYSSLLYLFSQRFLGHTVPDGPKCRK